LGFGFANIQGLVSSFPLLTFPACPHYDFLRQMHTNRFSYGFTYRYFFRSSGVADGV